MTRDRCLNFLTLSWNRLSIPFEDLISISGSSYGNDNAFVRYKCSEGTASLAPEENAVVAARNISSILLDLHQKAVPLYYLEPEGLGLFDRVIHDLRSPRGNIYCTEDYAPGLASALFKMTGQRYNLVRYSDQNQFALAAREIAGCVAPKLCPLPPALVRLKDLNHLQPKQS